MKDEKIYKWSGVVLQVGMYASLGAMLLGLGWWLLTGAPGGAATAETLIPVHNLPGELAALNPLALLNLGIVMLIATPAVMLLSQIIGYARAQNWRWAGIAGLIGLILLISLAASLGWLKIG